MCGFVGAFKNVKNISEKQLSAIGRMSKHRGPDDTGVWFNEDYKVVFNRLSIIELTPAGHQPMISPSSNWIIVFNGEIYNHLEIRAKLPDHKYKGKSDTETIIWAIENWGIEKTLKELNGMFAIVAYNKVEKNLFLARDFAGIKPLFYSIDTESIWFASQFNQVIEGIGKKTVTLNQSGVRDFLQLGYMQAPETVYKEIKQVLPGEVIIFNIQKQQQRKIFFKLPKQTNIKEYINCNQYNKFSQLMYETIKDQMLSDVPLGSFISSGIDSTLVAAFASKINQQLRTFTIGTNDYSGDERSKASEYSKILNLNHESQEVTENEIVSFVEDSIAMHGEPFGDPSSIPTFLITKYARFHNTVMLSGDGGDELFWGYPRWNTFLKNYERFKFSTNFRRIQNYIKRKFGFEYNYGSSLFKTPGEWVLHSHSHNSSDVMDAIMPESINTSSIKELYRFSYGPTRIEFRNWLRWNEFYGHLQRVLVKVDRMSMANSLEVRVPFLDKRIVEFSWNQFSSYGRNHFINKKFLKKQLGQFIPTHKINYEKIGFSIPLEKWLKGPLKSNVEAKLLNTRFYGENIIDKQVLAKYVKDFYEDKHQNAWGIWILYNWQKWGDYINSN